MPVKETESVLQQVSSRTFEEDLVTLTKDCQVIFEVPSRVRFDGQGCFTLPVVLDC